MKNRNLEILVAMMFCSLHVLLAYALILYFFDVDNPFGATKLVLLGITVALVAAAVAYVMMKNPKIKFGAGVFISEKSPRSKRADAL